MIFNLSYKLSKLALNSNKNLIILRSYSLRYVVGALYKYIIIKANIYNINISEDLA